MLNFNFTSVESMIIFLDSIDAEIYILRKKWLKLSNLQKSAKPLKYSDKVTKEEPYLISRSS